MNYANDRRINLLKELLHELKKTEKQLEGSIVEIGNLSEIYYQKALTEFYDEIQLEIDKYRDNIKRISEINNKTTENVNSWYGFAKNKDEMSGITFPIRYFLLKRKLRKSLRMMKNEVSSITIDNRFIKEKLALLEQQLEIKAIQKIKEDDSYMNYGILIQKKDLLISQLNYLIPTIPGLCPVSAGGLATDSLLEKISIL